MTTPKRNLLLMTGIPGTGKTSYGNAFAQEFGFVHVDLETQPALDELAAHPSGFIDGLIASDSRLPRIIVCRACAEFRESRRPQS